MSTEPTTSGGPFRAKFRSVKTRGLRLARSESVVGAARLASGTATGQLILVAISPILTRLYAPSDFGALAIFVSLLGLLMIISAAGYHLAIMLPKEEADATVVVGLALSLVALTSAITALFAVAALALGIFADSLGAWILLLPLAVLVAGASQVLGASAIRHGSFGLVAGSNLLKALTTAVSQISFGVAGLAAGGLISGNFLGQAAANTRLARPVVSELRHHRPSLRDMRSAAREYAQFPKHTMPATLVNAGFVSGTPLAVGWLFGTVTLGFWSIANSFVYLPSLLVSQAVGQAYYRKAVAVRYSKQQAKRLFDITVVSLAGLSAVPFAAMALVAPSLFSWVFGDEWRVAGEYAQVMIPALWVRFVAATVSTTALAHSANRVQVVTAALQIVALVAAIGVTRIWDLAPIGFLAVVSGLLVAVQALSILLFRRTISRSPLAPSAAVGDDNAS